MAKIAIPVTAIQNCKIAILVMSSISPAVIRFHRMIPVIEQKNPICFGVSVLKGHSHSGPECEETRVPCYAKLSNCIKNIFDDSI